MLNAVDICSRSPYCPSIIPYHSISYFSLSPFGLFACVGVLVTVYSQPASHTMPVFVSIRLIRCTLYVHFPTASSLICLFVCVCVCACATITLLCEVAIVPCCSVPLYGAHFFSHVAIKHAHTHTHTHTYTHTHK